MELYKCPCCEQYTLEEDYVDSYEICPVCGAEESMAGFPEEMKEEVIRKIEEQEIAWGRVEKRVEALT